MRRIASFLILTAIAAGALGLSVASAEDICYPPGCVRANGNSVSVDGAESNPPPARGYVTVTAPTATLPKVCADNSGAPGEPGATCVPFAVDGLGGTVCTDLACHAVAADGYLVVLDGAAGNPDPADGYVVVEGDGTACAAFAGGPYSDTTPNDGNPRSPSEFCVN